MNDIITSDKKNKCNPNDCIGLVMLREKVLYNESIISKIENKLDIITSKIEESTIVANKQDIFISNTSKTIEQIYDKFNESIKDLDNTINHIKDKWDSDNQKIQDKLNDLEKFRIQIVTICSVLTIIINIIGYLIK